MKKSKIFIACDTNKIAEAKRLFFKQEQIN